MIGDAFYAAIMSPDYRICRLTSGNVARMRDLNRLFADVFEDPDSYGAAPPDDAYLARQLGKDDVIVLVALEREQVIAGLVGYELAKLERARSEIYIYDLAVDAGHRRRGIATALIRHLQTIARDCGAWIIYVQADYGDEPAIALYEKLGIREDVMHFDIMDEPAN